MKYYLKRLGHQELGSVKNGKAQLKYLIRLHIQKIKMYWIFFRLFPKQLQMIHQ